MDSAISLTLLKKVFNKENIFAFYLPYKTSNEKSKEHAYMISEFNNVKLATINITKQIDNYFSNDTKPSKLRIGNKCARERMSILYDKASVHNALVIGTSNRSELIMGYGTLFGDMACAINPIGALFKTQIYKLAEFLCIPREIIEKAPSADLWEGQSDEEEMGISYQIIDEFSYMFFDKKEDVDTIIKSGINKEYCDKIINTYNRNNFKRIGPTILQLNV